MEYIKGCLPEPNLTTRSLMPENQETPIHFIRDWITPEKYFYRRNHFPYPELTSRAFFLTITGEVKRPLIFPYSYIKSLPSKRVTMVLECSGNRRFYFNPGTYGEQWQDGAISQGIWKGAALKDLLQITGIRSSAVEVVFEGLDFGSRKDMDGIFHYARSLPLEKVLDENTIIAYELNDKPIPYKHGFPLRLLVPQWYGMASVKWLRQITLIDHEFKGPFQAVDYVYYPNKENDLGKRPVTKIKVNSIIQQPMDLETLDTGTHEIYGIAWTGTGKITEVELSFDEGSTWHSTRLQSQNKPEPYSWVFWTYEWKPLKKGEYIIMSRAKDSGGDIQPFEAQWNRKGYGYNAVYSIKVKLE